MLKWMKPPDLPHQLEWAYSHEPELAGWRIRARNYNTFVANNLFVVMNIMTLTITYLMYAQEQEVFSAAITQTIFIVAAASMTHQRVKFAYRITASGVEYCQWKNFPEWTLTFLKWFAGLSAVIFVSLAAVDPTFFIGAVVGPGGMGLTYLAMANSKSFRRMHTEYHHHFLKWDELTQATVATNRDLVELEYIATNPNSIYMDRGSLYVFFKRAQKENLIAIIASHLTPNAAFDEGKVDVLN